MGRPVMSQYDTEEEYLEALDEYEAYLEALEERAEDREDCCQGWD